MLASLVSTAHRQGHPYVKHFSSAVASCPIFSNAATVLMTLVFLLLIGHDSNGQRRTASKAADLVFVSVFLICWFVDCRSFSKGKGCGLRL